MFKVGTRENSMVNLSAIGQLRDAVEVVYLFNKIDMLTAVLPVVVFAQSLCQEYSLSRLCVTLAWTYLELLQFTVSNQTAGTAPDEDAQNKPYRPIPAQKISLENAKILRYCMPFVTASVSHYLGVFPASQMMSFLTLVYNEGRLYNHWIGKHVVSALMYASTVSGALALSIGPKDAFFETFTPSQTLAIMSSVFIMCTTIQAQDFCDMNGDAEQGRLTFPLVYPSFSRLSMPITMAFWSAFLYIASDASWLVRFATSVLGVAVGARLYVLRSEEEDKMSHKLYDVWLCLMHIVVSSLSQEAVRAMTQVLV